MPSRGDITQAQSAASMEATRLHLELGTSYEGPVDVLGVTRELGLVLMMQPLDSLLGFYVRGERASGIVINSRVPESLQRFTLAHEIGHHVLGHDETADDEHALSRFDPTNVREVAAQAFAASLLMPLPLQVRTIKELPATHEGRSLAPTDAYLFSRQLGVSYEAGTWALYRRGLLNLPNAQTFIKAGARQAKEALRGGTAAENARADVWVLTEENNELSVLCRVGDEIHVHLPENTSTGTAWLLRSPQVAGLIERSEPPGILWSDNDGLESAPAQSARPWGQGESGDARVELSRDEHVTNEANALAANEDDVGSLDNLSLQPGPPDFLAGAGGFRELTFVPREQGDAKVVLELRRPWEADSPALSKYELDLKVRPRQLAGQGLFAPSPDSWVNEHIEYA